MSDKFVKVRIPARYGSVYVRRASGEAEHKGGDVVEMTTKQAQALGAELVPKQAEPEKPKAPEPERPKQKQPEPEADK